MSPTAAALTPLSALRTSRRPRMAPQTPTVPCTVTRPGANTPMKASTAPAAAAAAWDPDDEDPAAASAPR